MRSKQERAVWAYRGFVRPRGVIREVLLVSADPSFFDRPNCDLRARRTTQFGQDIGHMSFHCAFAEDELLGHRPIGLALGNQGCHLAFTSGQPAVSVPGSTAWWKRTFLGK